MRVPAKRKDPQRCGSFFMRVRRGESDKLCGGYCAARYRATGKAFTPKRFAQFQLAARALAGAMVSLTSLRLAFLDQVWVCVASKCLR